jgi:hypothetical protein
MTTDIQNMLRGEKAFFKNENYSLIEEIAPDELSKDVVYVKKDQRNYFTKLAIKIASVVIFPIGLYKIFHSLIGTAILPSYHRKHNDNFCYFGAESNYAKNLKKRGFVAKRITLDIEGTKVDAMILGKKENLEDKDKPWMIPSNGNGEKFADKLSPWSSSTLKLIDKVNANAVFFDYPSIGLSEGILPSKDMAVKTYRAIYDLVVNQIMAKKVICYGFSIGGGVQGEALNGLKLKDGVEHVFVKDRTFSTLANAAHGLKIKIPFVRSIMALTIKAFGWNLSSCESSLNLKAKEIILHTTTRRADLSCKKAMPIIHDGVISKEASLAHFINENRELLKATKHIIAINASHCAPISSDETKTLAREIAS